MQRSAINGWSAALLAAVLALAAPAYAASDTEMGVGTQRMSEMLQDMANELLRLSNELGRGNVNAAAEKALSRRTHEMYEMLQTMAGMLRQGMTMDDHMREQRDQTRRRLDELMSRGAGTK